MKGKPFLINRGKNILASLSCSPSQAEAWNAACWHATPSIPIWCQNVGLQVGVCRLLKCTLRTYSHSGFFSTPVSTCQNAISEIVKRMQSVQHGEQETQEKEKRAWALYSVQWKVLIGKETCSALFQKGQLPQWTRDGKEWIPAQSLRKPASLLSKPSCPTHLCTQIYF